MAIACDNTPPRTAGRGCVVFNPGSGSAHTADAFAAKARGRGDLGFCQTEGAGDAAELAQKSARDGCRVVLAAGGDGTVSGVVTGLMRARAAGVDPLPDLLVIPLGTGNDLARALGLPDDPCATLDLLDGGAGTAPLDVIAWSLDGGGGDDGPREGWAVNVLAGGFSSKLQAALTPEIKKRWGPLAYFRAAVETTSELSPHRLRISVDGSAPRRLAALNAIVANARYAGGGVDVAPEADPTDGLLDLVVVEPGNALDMAALAARFLAGDILEDEHVETARGRHFVIESEPPMPFNVDGDRTGAGRLDARVEPAALRVIVPAPTTA